MVESQHQQFSVAITTKNQKLALTFQKYFSIIFHAISTSYFFLIFDPTDSSTTTEG
jgi:hypothetical protein